MSYFKKIQSLDDLKIVEKQDKHERYQIKKSRHTKTGEEIYLVKIAGTLEREEFLQEKQKMKELGGYYSKFIHSFVFKENPTNKFERYKQLLDIDSHDKTIATVDEIQVRDKNLRLMAGKLVTFWEKYIPYFGYALEDQQYERELLVKRLVNEFLEGEMDSLPHIDDFDKGNIEAEKDAQEIKELFEKLINQFVERDLNKYEKEGRIVLPETFEEWKRLGFEQTKLIHDLEEKLLIPDIERITRYWGDMGEYEFKGNVSDQKAFERYSKLRKLDNLSQKIQGVKLGNFEWYEENYLHFTAKVDSFELKGLFGVLDTKFGINMELINIDPDHNHPKIEEQWNNIEEFLKGYSIEKYNEIAHRKTTIVEEKYYENSVTVLSDKKIKENTCNSNLDSDGSPKLDTQEDILKQKNLELEQGMDMEMG